MMMMMMMMIPFCVAHHSSLEPFLHVMSAISICNSKEEAILA